MDINEYDVLIKRAIGRGWTKLDAPCYVELHHIKPKCIGGDNNGSNIVALTAQEHYQAHKLLALIYPDVHELQYAWWGMCNQKNSGRTIHVGVDDYALSKSRQAELSRVMNSGRRHMTEEQNQRQRYAARNQSPEQKAAVSAAAKRCCKDYAHMSEQQKINRVNAVSSVCFKTAKYKIDTLEWMTMGELFKYVKLHGGGAMQLFNDCSTILVDGNPSCHQLNKDIRKKNHHNMQYYKRETV